MSKNIILQKLVLQNFKKHAQLEVEFSPTLTAIRGPNYAGKSSILKALFFALFGAVAAGSKGNLPRKGEKDCRVELFGLADTTALRITRTLNTAQVLLGGELVATGHTSVNAWVESAFGMDYKNVLRLSNSSQGETSALVTLGATALNRIIEEVSNARFVDELMERAGKKVSEAESKLAQLPPIEDMTEKEERIKELEIEIQKNDVTVFEQKDSVDRLKTELSESRLMLTAALNHNRAVQATIQEKIRIETDISITYDTLVSVMEELKTIEVPDVDNLKEAASAAQEKYSAWQQQNRSWQLLNEQVNNVALWLGSVGQQWQEKADEFGSQVIELEVALKRATEAGQKAQAEQQAAIKQLAQIKTDLDSSACPTCKRAFDESHVDHVKKLLADAEASYADKYTAFNKSKEEFRRIKIELDQVKAKMPPDGWASQLASKTEQKNELEQKMASFQPLSDAELYILKLAASTALEARNDAEQKQRRHSELSRRGTIQREKLAQLEEKLLTLKIEPEKDTAMLIEGERLTSEALSAQESLVSGLEAGGKLKRMEKDRLNAEVERAKLVAEARKEHESRAARFKAFQNWLRASKAAFMTETWDSLMAIVSEFSAQVTSNRVEQVGRDENGTFWFVENGERMDVEDCASGGQKSIFGVGLRIALPSLLPQGFGLVALDEPSAELNDEHAAALAGALRAQERQIILVTHRSGDEVAADAVVVLD